MFGLGLSGGYGTALVLEAVRLMVEWLLVSGGAFVAGLLMFWLVLLWALR